jgi:hypothetical protein
MKMRRHSKKRQEKPTVKGLTVCIMHGMGAELTSQPAQLEPASALGT